MILSSCGFEANSWGSDPVLLHARMGTGFRRTAAPDHTDPALWTWATGHPEGVAFGFLRRFHVDTSALSSPCHPEDACSASHMVLGNFIPCVLAVQLMVSRHQPHLNPARLDAHIMRLATGTAASQPLSASQRVPSTGVQRMQGVLDLAQELEPKNEGRAMGQVKGLGLSIRVQDLGCELV